MTPTSTIVYTATPLPPSAANASKALILAFFVGKVAVAGAVLYNLKAVSVASVVIMFLLLTIVDVFIWRRQRAQQLRAWESYRLELSDQDIRRTSLDAPTVYLRREEITAINDAALGLYVRSQAAGQTVFVPRWLPEFDAVKSRLATWRKMEAPVSEPAHLRNAVAACIGTMLLFAAFASTNRLAIAVPAGLLLLALLGSCLWILQRNPRLDTRIKRKMWVGLVPRCGIAGKLYLLVFP